MILEQNSLSRKLGGGASKSSEEALPRRNEIQKQDTNNQAKFVEGAYFLEACERDWREHEENFSRNLSVLQENMCRERIWLGYLR